MSSSQPLFDSKKLSNLHGPVLFEIFKFLHSKHLLSSIVLVCSEWREIVVECVLTLEVKEYNYKTWLQDQLDPFKQNPKAVYSNPHLQSYFHVERFVQSCTLFRNLNDLVLAGYGDLFSYELLVYLVRELKDLKKLVLSDVCLYKGRYSRRLRQKPINANETPSSSSSTGFFSRFKKKKEPVIVPTKVEITKANSHDIMVEFVRADIDDGPLKISSFKAVESLQKLFLYKVNLGLETYDSLMDHLVSLKELRIVDCYLEKFNIKSKSKQLSHIELNFSNSNYPTVAVDESEKNLHNSLVYLVLNNIEFPTITDFAPKCKNLKYLVIRKYFHFQFKNELSIEHLTLDSGTGITVENLDTVFKKAPNLKSLEIIHSSISENVDLFSFILNAIPNITRLVLRNVKHVTGSLLKSEKLEHLELSSLELVPECKIECPTLNTLILNSTTSLLDSSKSTAVMISGFIRELGLSMLSSTEGIASATALGNLTKLDFSFNRKLSSERLREIVSFTPKLEFLNLKMSGIGGVFLPPGSKIKTLLMSGSSITNYDLNILVKNCLNLTRLDIDCCANLKRIDLACLQKLNWLDLCETNMSLDDILSCIDSVPSLRYLYLRWIPEPQTKIGWTTQFKETLMNKFRNLLFLDLTGSYLSHADFLDTITRSFKDLVVVPKTQKFRYETATDPFVNYC